MASRARVPFRGGTPPSSPRSNSLKREILINGSQRETRVAILEDDRLVELLVDRPDHRRTVGDIYLGRVEAVLPGIQAAFVDMGQEKSAFLHASDLLEPDEDEDPAEEGDEDRRAIRATDRSAGGRAAEEGRGERTARVARARSASARPGERRSGGSEQGGRNPPTRDLSPPGPAQHPGHPEEGSDPSRSR